MAGSNKLKMLCLHGCRQDATVFNQKSGHLRKVLKSYAEFEYISAPHSIKSFESTEDYDYRSWWYTSPDKDYSSKTPSEIDEGFEETVRFVQNYINEKGPFDGILAFSQGASLLGMICLMIMRGEFSADLKFVILISGFKSPCIPHEKFYSTKVTIPSLHVIGDSDKIIDKERSEELMTYFENAEIIRHPGGHHVPASKEQKEPYQNFFKKMLLLKEKIDANSAYKDK